MPHEYARESYSQFEARQAVKLQAESGLVTRAKARIIAQSLGYKQAARYLAVRSVPLSVALYWLVGAEAARRAIVQGDLS